MSGIRRRTNLLFAFPLLNVLNVASAAQIEVLPGLDEHVIGRDNIGDRRPTWVLPCDPNCHGNIVGGISKGNGEEAVKAEQELSSAIVEC